MAAVAVVEAAEVASRPIIITMHNSSISKMEDTKYIKINSYNNNVDYKCSVIHDVVSSTSNNILYSRYSTF